MTVSDSPPAASAERLLNHPPFIALWISRFVSVIGVQIQGVALAWQIYAIARERHDVRHAALAVGMIGLAQFLPLFALPLPAGEIADRHDRKVIALGCMSAEVVIGLALTALAALNLGLLWPIYLTAVAFGASRAFQSPALTALGPMLVPRSLLPRSIAWNALAWQSGSIFGPAIGGLLCAVSPTAAYAVSTVLFLVGIGAMLVVRGQTRPPAPTATRWTLVKEGLAYVLGNKIVLGAISLDLFAVLLGGATALLPVFARDVLQVGAQGFGVLRAAPAIGAAAVAVVLAWRPIHRKAGLFMFGGVAAFGAATAIFAVSRNLMLSVGCLVVLGGADMLSVFIRQTLVQVVTPDAMRGRVGAVSNVFIGASNELGEFESGLAARFLGAVGAALFGGIGALVVTGAWARLFPALRRADRLE